MKSAGIALLEPIMRLEVVVPEDYLSVILKDLAKRRAEVKYIDVFKQNKIVYCLAPLAELLGYSTTVRIISSGHATFTLEFDHYELMDSANEAEAIKRATGFY
ncbi:Elongation factor G [Apis cerana cerana]|uniref:Elongation factor G n=2 Tax=Apis cerana TaxID=7461 RepID=A0A2A3ECM5_APICC|nr:Elongation factor G [Apis cerana cerana]